MDFQFIDEDAQKRAVLTNNMTQAENDYASLEVALGMEQAMAEDETLDETTREQFSSQATNTQARMLVVDEQYAAWKSQLDALPVEQAKEA